ncbi:AAA family ATPase [Actinomadura alba]|uniref:AAA family ATPase n=1 Tax=Actinomadura alba TaxID=406431 RepID=A0ABR7LKH1_9ACTN|nr:AAA family ATPase [Actinomadura alba]MBC6465264.1 AAA family ATPase [Actinomadura alba]
MAPESEQFVVITGGPGSGKSTLIAQLQEMGYARSLEAGRGIIQDQVAIGGPALPWTDPTLFAELMLCWELRSYRMAVEQKAPVFFDRGVPDIVGYLRLEGLPVPDHLHAAAKTIRYHPRVFIAPPWPEIYEQDSERKQSHAEAERTYEFMVATYTAYGYELVHLPRAPVAERTRFITDFLR